MKLCVMLDKTERHEAFKQVVESPAVPDIGETFGVRSKEMMRLSDQTHWLLWVRSRRWYLNEGGELWVDVWLTDDPMPIADSTTVDSCRRAIQIEGVARAA